MAHPWFKTYKKTTSWKPMLLLLTMAVLISILNLCTWYWTCSVYNDNINTVYSWKFDFWILWDFSKTVYYTMYIFSTAIGKKQPLAIILDPDGFGSWVYRLRARKPRRVLGLHWLPLSPSLCEQWLEPNTPRKCSLWGFFPTWGCFLSRYSSESAIEFSVNIFSK